MKTNNKEEKMILNGKCRADETEKKYAVWYATCKNILCEKQKESLNAHKSPQKTRVENTRI